MAEKNYEAIAKKAMILPGQPLPTKRRAFIYSRNKKGKTRFCLSAAEVGKTLIIDPENGCAPYARIIKELGITVWPVTKWEDIDNVRGFLRTGKHDFKIVCVDGTTKINGMALRYVMHMQEQTHLDRRPGIVDRRDYGKSGELMHQMILNFDALPISVIYTAQERMVSLDGDSEDETSEASTFFLPDLPNKARGSVNSVVDVIGRLYVTKTAFKEKATGNVVEKNQRRLWLDVHAQYDTGYRSEFELPEFIKNPTVAKLFRALDEGEDATKGPAAKILMKT